MYACNVQCTCILIWIWTWILRFKKIIGLLQMCHFISFLGAIATQIHSHLINNDIVDNFESAYKACHSCDTVLLKVYNVMILLLLLVEVIIIFLFKVQYPMYIKIRVQLNQVMVQFLFYLIYLLLLILLIMIICFTYSINMSEFVVML